MIGSVLRAHVHHCPDHNARYKCDRERCAEDQEVMVCRECTRKSKWIRGNGLRRKRKITHAVAVGTDPHRRRGIPNGSDTSLGSRNGPLLRVIELAKMLHEAGVEGCDIDQMCRRLKCAPKTVARDIKAMRHCGFEISMANDRAVIPGKKGAPFQPGRWFLLSTPFDKERI